MDQDRSDSLSYAADVMWITSTVGATTSDASNPLGTFHETHQTASQGIQGSPTEAATELLAAAASAGCKPRMLEESSDTFEREKRRTIMRGALQKMMHPHTSFSFIKRT